MTPDEYWEHQLREIESVYDYDKDAMRERAVSLILEMIKGQYPSTANAFERIANKGW